MNVVHARVVLVAVLLHDRVFLVAVSLPAFMYISRPHSLHYGTQGPVCAQCPIVPISTTPVGSPHSPTRNEEDRNKQMVDRIDQSC